MYLRYINYKYKTTQSCIDVSGHYGSSVGSPICIGSGGFYRNTKYIPTINKQNTILLNYTVCRRIT